MAYLFDLDGTLIDSEDAHKSAEAETFRTLGYDFSEADLFPFTGVPYKTMLATIAPSLTLEAFWAAHKPRLLGLIGTRIVPFPDVDECLRGISGNPAMIVTSSPRWYVEGVLDAFPVLRTTFKTYVCADDITNGKPHPEPFQKAASSLETPAQHCIAIEDSPNGIASAKAAGCYTIAVQRDKRLNLSAADKIVTSLRNLSDAIP
jgi:HAD superfamily hydrolase (TIGR01509 family)